MVTHLKKSRIVNVLYRGMWNVAGLVVTGRRFRNFLGSKGFKGLHVGCGHNTLPGWFNTDLFTSKGVTCLDIKKPLALPDNFLDVLFAEHVIEHLTCEECTLFLREAKRTLKPGGILRLVTPDLGFFLETQANPFNPSAAVYLDWFAGGKVCRKIAAETALNAIIAGHGHRHVYSEDTLTTTLKNAGFVDISRFSAGDSDSPCLRGIEGHGKLAGIGDEINRLESLVIEAVHAENFVQANS